MENSKIVEKRKNELGKAFGPISFSEKEVAGHNYVTVSYRISGRSKCIGLNVSKRLYHTKKEEVQMYLLEELERHERY